MFERLQRNIRQTGNVEAGAFGDAREARSPRARHLAEGLQGLLNSQLGALGRFLRAVQRLLGQLIPMPGGFAIVPALVVLLWLGGCWPVGGGGGFDPNPQPPAIPPMKVTLLVGEQIDRNIWCREPVNQSPVMTIANAPTLANSAPAIASAALVDPNGNNGQGSVQSQGLIESPVVRIKGLKPSPPRARITLDISCPTLYFNTEGIGMARHRWLKATIIVTVVAPKGPGGGGKPGRPGQPGDEPAPGPDTPTDHTGDHGSMQPPEQPTPQKPSGLQDDLPGDATCTGGGCQPSDPGCTGDGCDADSGCTANGCGSSVCDPTGCKPEPTHCGDDCDHPEPTPPPSHDDGGFFDPSATPFDPVAR